MISNDKPYYLLTFSAKTKDALNKKIIRLNDWLNKNKDITLQRLSYTLNKCRFHFLDRHALIANSMEDARNQLQYVCNNFNKVEIIKNYETIKLSHGNIKNLIQELSTNKSLSDSDYRNKLIILQNLYCDGGEIDWEEFYRNDVIKPISLPSYPFEKIKCWVENKKSEVLNRKEVVLKQESQNSTKINLIIPRSEVPENSNVTIDENFSLDHIQDKICEILKNNLLIKNEIDMNKSFIELGLDSIVGVELIKNINTEFKINLNVSTLYDYPTIATLSVFIGKHKATSPGSSLKGNVNNDKHKLANESIKLELNKLENVSVYNKKLVIHKSGCIDDIDLTQSEVDSPSENEIQVKVRAATIMLPDLLCVTGLYPTMPRYPFTPGFEISGEVVKIGKNVKQIQVGDKVFGYTGQGLGGQAEIVNVPAFSMMIKPAYLRHEEAVTLPIAFITAYHAVHLAEPLANETILINSAGSSTGLIALQLAKLRSAKIIATVGSHEKVTYLKKIGIDNVVNYQDTDVTAYVNQLTQGKGVDVVINMLSGEMIQKSLDLLGPGGRYVELATGALRAATHVDLSRFTNNQRFFSVDLRKVISQLKEDDVSNKNYFKILIKMLNDKLILPIADTVFSFEDYKKAYEHLQNRKNIGRIVLKISEETEVNKLIDKKDTINNEIAIIGFSCRFPGADNADQFWDNLAQGKSSITEVPTSRWSIKEYYDEDPNAKGKAYSKWGGFLNGIEEFDPLFFNLSPTEAESMDPQQRLFLEESWKVMEVAGYTPETLAQRNCGVYVGVAPGDYHQLIKNSDNQNKAHELLGMSSAILASRISYLLDLKGPSVAIDTACSSSLVAVHQACQAISHNEVDLAIAGGVCVMATPEMHIMTSKAGMLSPDGKCKTFDNSANGFVPGEGVGVILLKALNKALEDDDQIFAVIKGSGINQDGKTNGITAPSVKSQTSLELQVYERFKIDPDNISYVEAHGTGTKLGDPIEVEALTNAFREYTERKSYCAIGSVKTNIGHALAAAGISGVIKTVLCMQYKKLVPTLNINQENEHINFKESPFYINRELKDWNAEYPRLATVSSFGFNGTNAHVVLAEMSNVPVVIKNNKPFYLVALSARAEFDLKQKIIELVAWLRSTNRADLENISYTLNAGRHHFDFRVAVVAGSVQELQIELIKLIEGNVTIIKAEVKTFEKQDIPQLMIDLKNKAIDKTAYKNSLLALGKYYINGQNINWNELHIGESKKKIVMPTYPFNKNKYWIQQSKKRQDFVDTGLHPLIDINVSNVDAICFSKRLTANEFYLKDHKVNNNFILPGVAYIEMARAAGQLVQPDNKVVAITQITWQTPIVLNHFKESLNCQIYLYPSDQFIEFEIMTEENEIPILHAHGKIDYLEVSTAPLYKLNDIKSKFKNVLDKNEIYKLLDSQGLRLGSSFQSLIELWFNENEALGKLQLQEGLSLDKWMLHPSLLDGALQTVMALKQDAECLYLPVSIGRVEIIQPLKSSMYSYIKATEKENHFFVQIMDEEGQLLVQVNDFVLRAVNNLDKADISNNFYTPVWEKSEIARQSLEQDSLWYISDRESANLIAKLKSRFAGDIKVIQTKELPLLDILNLNLPRYIIFQINNMSGLDNSFFCVINLMKNIFQTKLQEKIDWLVSYDLQGDESYYAEALSGLIKTIAQENPKLQGRLLGYDRSLRQQTDQFCNTLLESIASNEVEVIYKNNSRYVKRYVSENKPENQSNQFKNQGIYLITGGAGDLGLIIAEYLSKKYHAKLVLLGRSELNESQEQKIKTCISYGAEIIYEKGDVTKYEDLERILVKTKNHFGKINGIIHSAGTIKDSFIINKTKEDMVKVLSPKIEGILQLDKLTKQENLDCFVLFSSIASILGNAGQVDYAYANSFLDAFSAHREKLRSEGKRFGKTISINWPLWEKGGMQVADETLTWMKNGLGLTQLSNEDGLEALEYALFNSKQCIVLPGKKENIKNWIIEIQNYKGKIHKLEIVGESQKENQIILEKIRSQIVKIVSELLKINAQQLDINQDISKYGMDSITVTSFTNIINESYQLRLTPAILFEHPTLASFAKYLLLNHQDKFEKYYNVKLETNNSGLSPSAKPVHQAARARFRKNNIKSNTEIAVIGMSGVFPGAPNLEMFWDLLEKQKSGISEIPKERWDWEKVPGKKNIKWGGFIEGIDLFDAAFFNISPREAELMDPQQRIFLQTVWKAVEDAGYTTKDLSQIKTGLFVGVSSHDYAELLQNANERSAHASTGVAHCVVPNRVSYFLNWNGPSEAVDTACSSSLFALHHAIQSIHSGDCEVAIAGGVNAMLTSSLFQAFNDAGMLSEDGHCKTFDKSANGYVRGEGVGAILLKPLSKALEDNDNIYGIIKGSATNHGGHVSSLTVPNPNAQAELIKATYDRANVTVDTISFIEAHGTGTSLGDPIEINGLKKAFSMMQTKNNKGYCALGTVKTNIGHLEAAAGIAGIIKVLLSMNKKKLPGNLHFNELNPYIDINDSFFYILDKTKDWEHLKDEHGTAIPYRAGISSFGFGGANAHVIIEEAPIRKNKVSNSKKPYYLLTLSARSEEALNQKFTDLNEWLNCSNHENIENISYTLNIGRSHFDCRAAIVVSGIEELKEALHATCTGNKPENIIIGKLNKRIERQHALQEFSKYLMNELTNSDNQLSITEHREKLLAIGNLYVDGYQIDLIRLHEGESKQKISLPSYPFAKDRHWVNCSSVPSLETQQNNLVSSPPIRHLHILEKTWEPSAFSENLDRLSGNLLILVNSDIFSKVQILFEQLPNIDPIFINAEEINQNNISYSKTIGLVDFSDLGMSYKASDQLNKINFLQSVVREKMSSNSNFQILHFTSGLQSLKGKCNTLSGAGMAGLLGAIASEYGKIDARTIDIDFNFKLENIDKLIHILTVELNSDKENSEICYREGKRYVPTLTSAFRKDAVTTEINIPKNISANKVYLITGGTGGIGLEVADYLARSGAKHLILMGKQKIPPKKEWKDLLESQKSPEWATIQNKIKKILAIEALGTDVTLYFGSLTEENTLKEFVSHVRETIAPIGGVIHCAGLVDKKTPVFINKTTEDIKKTIEPKISGLITLHEIFKQDNLDFFLLFSSVSSQIPLLGTACADYAMANSFMDYFAQYYANQGYPYQSIQWGNWKEVGLGESKGIALSQLGILPHLTSEGLYLLEQILNNPKHINAMACITDSLQFKNEELLKVKRKSIVTLSKDVSSVFPSVTVLPILRKIFSEELKLPEAKLDDDISFGDFGVDSILLAELVKRLESHFKVNLDPSILIEHSTLNALSHYLERLGVEETKDQIVVDATKETKELLTNSRIAVIGMACHFPGAPTKEIFWKNLVEGKSSIREIPDLRWNINAWYDAEGRSNKSISKWGGFIEGIEYFDPEYFGLSEIEALHMDPLERQLLEASVQLMCDAGYKKEELWGKKVGVFVGARSSSYASRIKEYAKSTIIGIGQNFIATNVSHVFNFKGPSLVIDTACSSSLVSIHMACQSLLNGESVVAVAGGVDIVLDEAAYLVLSEAKALSPDGKCHTFDEKANGFVPGEGCGLVLLKPLEKAIADGDRIYGVIEGSAVNNDGHTMGITTPNPQAQQQVIEEALTKANVNPETIEYIEAHGTGTMIGDPIELTALTNVFGKYTSNKKYCAIGSVKSNIGHLLSASGVASFIKVALQLYHKQLVPTLNCIKPNPRFDFEKSPFYPNTQLQKWNSNQETLRAGVSSFGFGGTNAHCIISNYIGIENKNYKSSLPYHEFKRKKYWLSKIAASKSTASIAGEMDDYFEIRQAEVVNE